MIPEHFYLYLLGLRDYIGAFCGPFCHKNGVYGPEQGRQSIRDRGTRPPKV